MKQQGQLDIAFPDAAGPEVVDIPCHVLPAVCANAKAKRRHVFSVDWLKGGQCRLTILPAPPRGTADATRNLLAKSKRKSS